MYSSRLIIYCNIFVDTIIVSIIEFEIFVKSTIKILIANCFFFEQDFLNIKTENIDIIFNLIWIFKTVSIDIETILSLKASILHKYIDLNNLLLIKTELIIESLTILLTNIVANFELVVVCFVLIEKSSKKIAIDLNIWIVYNIVDVKNIEKLHKKNIFDFEIWYKIDNTDLLDIE